MDAVWCAQRMWWVRFGLLVLVAKTPGTGASSTMEALLSVQNVLHQMDPWMAVHGPPMEWDR